MGNRANVVFTDGTEFSPAIYLHWNGGPESVYAFLDEMNRRNVRTGDNAYESARFCHIVGDYFDQSEVTSMSLGLCAGPQRATVAGIEKWSRNTDMSDNGLYLVHREHSGKEWKTTVRRFKEIRWTDDGTKVRELSKEEVSAEEKAARKHCYQTGINSAGLKEDETIAECFERMRPKVSAVG